MRNRISQYSLLLVSFFVLLFSLSLVEGVGAGTAPPKISPTEGDAGHPFTLIDPQEARLANGAVAVFQAYGIEVVVPVRTHKPYKTAQGRLPQDMYAGEYTVVVRNLDGSEFVIGTFTVLGLSPEPPSIQPDIGAWETAFTITDPLGRIQEGDLAVFYADGSAPSIDRVADNIYISADGMTLTGTVPYAAEDGVQNFVAVRPSLTDSSRFGDLMFFVTLGPSEGCDAAFWKENTDLWHPQFPPNMYFNDAFGRNAFPGLTLHQVVSFIDGYDPNMVDIPLCVGVDPILAKNSLIQLGLNAVAALQNAATPVNYNLDIDTVILSFQQAYDKCTLVSLEDTKSVFETYNNQGCPF